MEDKSNPPSSDSGTTNQTEPEYYSVEELKQLFFGRIAQLGQEARAQGLEFCDAHMEKYQPGQSCRICDVLKSIK